VPYEGKFAVLKKGSDLGKKRGRNGSIKERKH
jgi:hypothetical protein